MRLVNSLSVRDLGSISSIVDTKLLWLWKFVCWSS